MTGGGGGVDSKMLVEFCGLESKIDVESRLEVCYTACIIYRILLLFSFAMTGECRF